CHTHVTSAGEADVHPAARQPAACRGNGEVSAGARRRHRDPRAGQAERPANEGDDRVLFLFGIADRTVVTQGVLLPGEGPFAPAAEDQADAEIAALVPAAGVAEGLDAAPKRQLPGSPERAKGGLVP